MGHREDLLAGARRCLQERGYARTTARDIVAASGTNLASIGYHFGSKDALLGEAMVQAFQEWGGQLEQLAPIDAAAPALEQLEATWARMLESLDANRALWVASVEAFAQADHLPEVRERLAATHEFARTQLAGAARSLDARVDARSARAIGKLQMTLLAGLTVQRLLDPARAPSARDLADALRALIAIAPARRSTARPRVKPRSRGRGRPRAGSTRPDG